MDYNDLLFRARRMQLTEDEIDLVAQRLRDKVDPERDATLMLILGWAQAKQYEPEVAAVLKETSDTVSQKQALQTLCFYWNLTAHYLEFVRRIVQTPPDEDRFAWIIAVSVAGKYLAEHEDCQLLSLINDCYKDESAHIDDRRQAYEALYQACGVPYVDVYLDTLARKDVVNNPNPVVISTIQTRLEGCP